MARAKAQKKKTFGAKSGDAAGVEILQAAEVSKTAEILQAEGVNTAAEVEILQAAGVLQAENINAAAAKAAGVSQTAEAAGVL